MTALPGFGLTAAFLVSAASIAFLFGSDWRAGAESGCGVTTVQGTYALHGTGVASGAPWVANGRFVFDGNGRSSGTAIESYGGVVDDGILEGTYTVESDCRGSATYRMQHRARSAGQGEYRHEVHRVDLVVAAGGQRIFWVVVGGDPKAAPAGRETVDAGIMASGTLERM